MIRRVLQRLSLVVVCLAMPAIASAQEAVIAGTINDTTGGVLPGVTVTASHVATGNTFVAVTNEQGAFRLPARVGVYSITFELPGFATLTRTGVELLAGQTVDLKLQMALSTLAENVTVTGEAPLLNVSQSSLG